MNIKHNINYFKKSDSTKFVGIALVILGFVLFYFGWGWISYILMTLSVPVGVVLFIVGSSGRSDESVIETCIEERTEGLEVELEDVEDFADKVMCQHYIISYGDNRGLITDLCNILGIEVI